MLDAPVSCKCPAFASSQCVAIVSSLIDKHKRVQVDGNVCNVVHKCSSEYVVPFQGSSGDTLLAKVKAVESVGKGGNGDHAATVLSECLMNFI